MAFYYLLGNAHRAKVVGLTSTFGNATAADAFGCSRRMLEALGLSAIPQAQGAEAGQDPRESAAARLIAELALRHEGELDVLAVGSLTNLYGAWLLDEDLFKRLNRVVLMGGITAPLNFHGRVLDELNFSCSHEAARHVLENATLPAIITGNSCLPVAHMPQEEFLQEMCAPGNASSRHVAQKCGYRFEDKKLLYGAAGTYCWDVVAAAYLLEPELFETEQAPVLMDQGNLCTGFLQKVPVGTPGAGSLVFPTAKSREGLQAAIYRSWK